MDVESSEESGSDPASSSSDPAPDSDMEEASPIEPTFPIQSHPHYHAGQGPPSSMPFDCRLCCDYETEEQFHAAMLLDRALKNSQEATNLYRATEAESLWVSTRWAYWSQRLHESYSSRLHVGDQVLYLR